MIQVSFTEYAVKKLQDISKNHPHPFVRTKALVLLLKSQKIPHWQIKKLAGISGNTLRSYLKAYKRRGIESILKLNFRKPESSLEPFRNEILKYLKKNPSSTIKQACYEIAKLTGVTLGQTQVRLYLKSLGFKFRKACGIPAKADPEKQQKFLKEKLKPRLREAKKSVRDLYFVDAAHFVHGAFLGFFWSIKRIFVRTPSGRKRFNVLGALHSVTKELLKVTNDSYISSEQVCELLELIASSATKPVTVVLDNASYQRCKLVMDKANELGIELLFLPTYSPNLNLIERLWKFTKKKCLNSIYYPDFKSFRLGISSFLEDMHSKHTDELQSLLTPKFQVFKKSQLKFAR